MKRILCLVPLLFAGLVMLTPAQGQQAGKDTKKEEKKKPAPDQPPPTEKISYGKHPRQLIDFWKAKSAKPTPLVLYIHGGGWRGGDKSGYSGKTIQRFLDEGISVATINYRYTQQGEEQGVVPPVKAPLEDAARALQVIRSKASEWNLDKKRIGATGGSAGACSSLWLAFHNDLADPKSEDPIARESTRLYCAAVSGAQTSLDPKELLVWLPNYTYGAHAFGAKSLKEVADEREKYLKWIKEYSPIEHVSSDDPQIFMEYKGVENPKPGEVHPDPTHSAVMGMKLEERLKAAKVDVVLIYNGRTHDKYKSSADYLIDRLKK